MIKMFNLVVTKRTDLKLLKRMENHYSKPKGFVGRNICYAIFYDDIYYGHIVAGSATLHLPGRHEFLGTSKDDLNRIINNIFFNVRPKQGKKYPCRNFTTKAVSEFVKVSQKDWSDKYGDRVLGFETLIELPRTGQLYKRAGWKEVGITKGYTCKRVAGKGTDSWSGKRVWSCGRDKLRPKRVLCYSV